MPEPDAIGFIAEWMRFRRDDNAEDERRGGRGTMRELKRTQCRPKGPACRK